MISTSKYKSAVIEFGKRILKVDQFGTKTAKEVYPFGFDSLPYTENLTAIYLETSNKDEAVIVGYINADRLEELAPGESRIYSLGSSGELRAYAFARASGVLELNGEQFSAVRFQNLKSATDASDNLINAELVKIQTAITALGGTYVAGTISTDLTNSESPTVKLK